jgi:hypothetical protein
LVQDLVLQIILLGQGAQATAEEKRLQSEGSE